MLDTYGNVVRLSIDEETSAITNLLAELYDNHYSDMENTGMSAWADELQKRNKALAGLVRSRYKESSERTDLVMREVRVETDNAYRELAICIEAVSLTDEEGYDKKRCEQAIRQLNIIVEHYNALHHHSQNQNQNQNPQSPAGEEAQSAADDDEENEE